MALNVRLRRLAKRLRSRETFEELYGLLYFSFPIPPYDGMQNFTRMKFLYDSILKFATCSSGVALEVGCFKGCSTVFLAKACLKRGIKEVYAIDLFTGTPSSRQTFDTYEQASHRLNNYNLYDNVRLIRAHSLEYDWHKQIDVFHLDADHAYEAVVADIRRYIPFVNDGGIVILDDYDAAHPGVRRAVHELLLAREEFDVVDVHYEGLEYGSICLRRRDPRQGN